MNIRGGAILKMFSIRAQNSIIQINSQEHENDNFTLIEAKQNFFISEIYEVN